MAVPFFFILSGFVFFTFYKDKIYNNKISFTNFFLLRFSRLYPTHLFTLILVLILQQIFLLLYSDYFIYPNNTVENFLLHFFLVQEWGLNEILNIKSAGFNHPSWSISVEMFAYITFFVLSIFFIRNIYQTSLLLIILIIAHIFIKDSIESLSIGIILFYFGGLVYFFLNTLTNYFIIQKKYFLILIIFLNILIFGGFFNNFFLNFQNNHVNLIGSRMMILLFFIKFPLIIINLIIIQYNFKNLGKSFQILGELSYTIYLIHFPLQIMLMILNNYIFHLNLNTELFFIIYLCTVIFSSYTLFKYYELPCKIYIRKYFLDKHKL